MKIPQAEDYPEEVPSDLAPTPENALMFNTFILPEREKTVPGLEILFSPPTQRLLSFNFCRLERARVNRLRCLRLEHIKDEFNKGLRGNVNDTFNMYFHFSFFHFDCQHMPNLTPELATTLLKRLELYYPVHAINYYYDID